MPKDYTYTLNDSVLKKLCDIATDGKKDITNTNEVDVTTYATAQVVDANLLAANIKKNVTILGIVGTLEGGGDLDELMQEEF